MAENSKCIPLLHQFVIVPALDTDSHSEQQGRYKTSSNMPNLLTTLQEKVRAKETT